MARAISLSGMPEYVAPRRARCAGRRPKPKKKRAPHRYVPVSEELLLDAALLGDTITADYWSNGTAGFDPAHGTDATVVVKTFPMSGYFFDTAQTPRPAQTHELNGWLIESFQVTTALNDIDRFDLVYRWPSSGPVIAPDDAIVCDLPHGYRLTGIVGSVILLGTMRVALSGHTTGLVAVTS